MPSLQQQIIALFSEYESDIREIVTAVLQIEQEQIHLERPRVKEQIEDALDRVVRDSLGDQ